MKLKVVVTGVCGLCKVAADDIRVLAAADLPYRGGANAHDHSHGSPRAAAPCPGTCVPRHRSFLRFSEQDGLEAIRAIKFITKKADDGSVLNHYVFGNEFLTLRRVNPNTQPSLTPVKVDPSGIVEMVRVSPHRFKVNPALVASTYEPVESRVAAVLSLPTGSVSALNIDTKHVHKFEPTLGTEPYIGSFAREVVVDMDLPGEQWLLESRPYNNDTAPRPVLKLSGDARNFVLTFGNAPIEDLLDVEPVLQEEVDLHFALLYRLLADAPEAESLPVRVSARQVQTTIGGTNCPPVIFG